MSGKKTCPSIFYILLHTNITILSEYYSYNLYSLSPGLPLWFISVYPGASGLAHDICVRILRFHGPRIKRPHTDMETWNVEWSSRTEFTTDSRSVQPLCDRSWDLESWRRFQPGETERNTKNAPSFPPCIARTRSVSASNGKPGTIFYTDSAFASLNKTNCSVLTVSPQQKERKERFEKKAIVTCNCEHLGITHHHWPSANSWNCAFMICWTA